MELLGNYIHGKFELPVKDNARKSIFQVKKFCPANTDLKLWDCFIDYEHVDRVIESSISGFQQWKRLSQEERNNALLNYKKAILEHKEKIAEAISLETGKPFWEALGEAAALASKVDISISESLPRIATKKIENIQPNTTGKWLFKPIGPCLVIGPFNFPCHLANGQIVNALLAGNSVIFKPSEKTCYSGQLLAQCMQNAGLPDGTFNMIQGDGEIARRLTKDKNIKGIFFTGSKEVGKKILSNTYKDLSKLVSLELGGKNTTIIHHDTNIVHTLAELIKSCFLTTGQRCTSTGVIAIHKNISQEFINKFHDLAKKLIIDHPIEHEFEPFMGPLIDQNSLDDYLMFMGMAKREGFEEIMRGKKLDKKFSGHYVSPSIHFTSKYLDKSHFLTSEIFGPNCTFVEYDDIEEAISIANKSEYGLAGAIFTKDQTIAEKCLEEVDVGVFNINRSTVGAASSLPFGGVKNSGNYRPAAVTTIDSSTYQVASLNLMIGEDSSDALNEIKGLLI